MNQKVWHHQGVWCICLDQPSCLDNLQKWFFFRKSSFGGKPNFFEPLNLKPYLGLETQLGRVILLRVQSGQTSFRTFLVFLQLSAWRAIVAGKPSFHRYLMPSARRSTLTWNMASIAIMYRPWWFLSQQLSTVLETTS